MNSAALSEMTNMSPDGRFRFVMEVSENAVGTAYDTENGLLVGWNVLDLRGMTPMEKLGIRRGIDLLKGLHHEHVLGVHSSWDGGRGESNRRRMPWNRREHNGERGDDDDDYGGTGASSGAGNNETLVFLTPPTTTLEAFVETKVEFLRWRVVKRWCKQVLEALTFLHEQATPIVHRTLSLSNVYIDPSKSHLFVGAVQDIVPPPFDGSSPETQRLSSGQYRIDRDEANAAGRRGGHDEGEGASSALSRDDGESPARRVGARDVEAFGTLLIEMILKKRLDPSLASDAQFIEVLLAVSDWPATVVQFIRLCRMPDEEKPAAKVLLKHPFLDLDDELDDEPIDINVDLPSMAACAMRSPTSHGSASGSGQRSCQECFVPPPLLAPFQTREGHAASHSLTSTGSVSGSTVTPVSSAHASAFGAQQDVWCTTCRTNAVGCLCSPHYPTSFGSTEFPSPSSPSAASSFGVPATPSPPPKVLIDRVGEVAKPKLSGKVTATAVANASAIAAKISASRSRAQLTPGSIRSNFGRLRAVSYSGRRTMLGGKEASSSHAPQDLGVDRVGERGRGGGSGSGSAGNPVPAASSNRSRSASEDAVWDMLPQDESQCRRPFTVGLR